MQLDFQRQQLEVHRNAQERDAALRQLALELAHVNEQAANNRLVEADRAVVEFQRRGQTYAMWYTGVVSAALIAPGLVCAFLAVAGAISMALGLGAGSILIAGGLLAGIAKVAGKFLPRGGSGDGDQS